MKLPKHQHCTQQITQEAVVEGMVVEEAMEIVGKAFTRVVADMVIMAEVIEVKVELEVKVRRTTKVLTWPAYFCVSRTSMVPSSAHDDKTRPRENFEERKLHYQ